MLTVLTLDPKLDPTTAVRAHILPTITTCLNLFHQKRFSIQLFASLSEAVAYYEVHEPKGECVLVIEGMSREAIEQEEKEKWADVTIEDHMEYYLSRGLDRKEAMKQTAKDRGVPKREIYNYLEKGKS